jgi:hypothetical protein
VLDRSLLSSNFFSFVWFDSRIDVYIMPRCKVVDVKLVLM